MQPFSYKVAQRRNYTLGGIFPIRITIEINPVFTREYADIDSQ